MVREQKRVELTMAKNDVNDKQRQFDQVAPDEASQRKMNEATAQANTYINDKQTKFNYELKLLNQSLDQADALANSATFILAQKYNKSLDKKHINVASEFVKNKEQTFTNRRRFLDADPQEGVPGIGHFQSVDEQIMLAFWVSFVLFIGTVMFYVVGFLVQRAPNIKFSQAVMIWLGGFGAIVFVAHHIIRYATTVY